jgi:hypothetical protein
MLDSPLNGSGIRLYFAEKGMSGNNAVTNAILAREWAAARQIWISNGGNEI